MSDDTSRLLSGLGIGTQESNTSSTAEHHQASHSSHQDDDEDEESKKKAEMEREEARLLRAFSGGIARKSGGAPAKKWGDAQTSNEAVKPVAQRSGGGHYNVPPALAPAKKSQEAPRVVSPRAAAPPAAAAAPVEPAKPEDPEAKKRREEAEIARAEAMAEKEAARLAARFGKRNV